MGLSSTSGTNPEGTPPGSVRIQTKKEKMHRKAKKVKINELRDPSELLKPMQSSMKMKIVT